jgi:hypothetical protein
MVTKRQVAAAMKAHGIQGELRGAGRAWEVELPTDEALASFEAHVGVYGGYRCGYGAWVVKPGYEADPYDFNNKASRAHY